jgi:hypothetical protein
MLTKLWWNSIETDLMESPYVHVRVFVTHDRPVGVRVSWPQLWGVRVRTHPSYRTRCARSVGPYVRARDEMMPASGWARAGGDHPSIRPWGWPVGALCALFECLCSGAAASQLKIWILLAKVPVRCNGAYILHDHLTNLQLTIFINNIVMCSNSFWIWTPYHASTDASHPNLHEHNRIRDLSNKSGCSYLF